MSHMIFIETKREVVRALNLILKLVPKICCLRYESIMLVRREVKVGVNN